MQELGQTRENLGSLVAAELRAAIFSGVLAPGERLKQEDLAVHLSVSRIPVREALRVLEAEGLIESIRGKGSRVVTVTPKDAADVLTVRGTLEGLAARLAAERMTGGEIETLRATIADGRLASEALDFAAANEAHTRFHLHLARTAGNTYLYAELEALPAKTEWIVSSLLKTRGAISWSEHEAIMEACRQGQADRAEQLTREHSDKVVEALT